MSQIIASSGAVLLGRKNTSATHTGDLVESVLFSLTIPAGTMLANSQLNLRSWHLGSGVAGTVSYQWRLGCSSAVAADGAVVMQVTGAVPNVNTRLNGILACNNSTSSQTGYCEAATGTTVLSIAPLSAVKDVTTQLILNLTATLTNFADTSDVHMVEVILYK